MVNKTGLGGGTRVIKESTVEDFGKTLNDCHLTPKDFAKSYD